MEKNIFLKGDVILSSGQKSDFKIDCDGLSDDDIKCIAYLISKNIWFKDVIGVPTGGIRLQNELKQYAIDDHTLPLLICDDVVSTGKSMEKLRLESNQDNVVGVAIFARGKHPSWIKSIFKM